MDYLLKSLSPVLVVLGGLYLVMQIREKIWTIRLTKQKIEEAKKSSSSDNSENINIPDRVIQTDRSVYRARSKFFWYLEFLTMIFLILIAAGIGLYAMFLDDSVMKVLYYILSFSMMNLVFNTMR